MTSLETHPIPNGYIPNNCQTLVIGTFPPKKEYFRIKDYFFYSSPQNHFWNRVENIFPDLDPKLKKTKTRLANITKAENRAHKEAFSNEKKIGFIDVFHSIRRLADTPDDADIVSISNIVSVGILDSILSQNANIDRICCTYSLAYRTLVGELDKNKVNSFYDEVSANKVKLEYKLGSRIIEVFLLYPATRSRDPGWLKDAQYKKLLFRL